MPSKQPIIQTTNLHKKYLLHKSDRQRLLSMLFGQRKKTEEKQVLDGINLEIARGESIAIMGRNGEGKSTLLKIISGVVAQDRGDVNVQGTVVAMLELSAGFDLEFTGRENLYIKGRLLGMTNEEVATIEHDVIAFAELGSYIDQPLRTYSSGMKARLGFAFYSHCHADILVIDEALSVGDAEFRKKCRQKIDAIVKNEHITVLLVTHNVADAKAYCQRAITLKNGKITADKPTAEL